MVFEDIPLYFSPSPSNFRRLSQNEESLQVLKLLRSTATTSGAKANTNGIKCLISTEIEIF